MQLRNDTQFLDKQSKTDVSTAKSEPAGDYNDGLLGTAVPIMILAYATALAIVTLTFLQSGDTLLSIGICAVYLVMFFGVPGVMTKIRNGRDTRWTSRPPEATSERVSVFTGWLGRRDALLQIVTVPVAVAFAFAAFAIIWISVRPG
ncbi:MAG TPA: hypothetical protein PKD49_11895 [Hyphomicrobium sp.]|nr:hypothetical protein [Hyphomicrobium sp.]